jgi:phosphoglycolate phosphatase
MPSVSDTLCVIVDLDGPILEGSARHYACYRQILVDHGREPLPIDRYWRMKRQGVCVRDQLAATGAEAMYDRFKAMWLTRIESPEMLALDRLQPGAAETLRRWHEVNHVRLVLATLRQHEAGVREQLHHAGLASIWATVVVCPPHAATRSKSGQVAASLGRDTGDGCLWIGDSEVDVQSARAFGCPVWAVSCGVRNDAFLASLAPDRLSAAIADIDLRVYTRVPQWA